MKDKELMPYYKHFIAWLQVCKPGSGFTFMTGNMGVKEAQPLVREWGGDEWNLNNTKR